MLSACGQPQIPLDYGDEVAFEADLNEGKNLEGKTVSFTAAELHLQSLYGYIAVCPAIRMAYCLAHSEPMLDITVQELCDYRRQRNKKHDADDAEQLSAQQGGQQRPQW